MSGPTERRWNIWQTGAVKTTYVEKTKEVIVDFRKSQPCHSPLLINNRPVEVVDSTKFLCTAADWKSIQRGEDSRENS